MLLAAPAGAARLAASSGHSVSIHADASLWAWGDNSDGQLGDGTTANRKAPVRIGLLTDWVAAAANEGYTLALRTDASLWAWGNNQYAQLGQFAGTPTLVAVDPELTPLPVSLAAFTARPCSPRAPGLDDGPGVGQRGLLGGAEPGRRDL